ncbi:MAG: hypothetical protein IJN81_09325 [Clostridia bacterium]|nr:hypothetical protein [Clostridia bacterium]
MKLNVKEIAVFSMLGAMMYASKVLMELLPNLHLIGVFIVAMTVVYRKKALYPLYVFVFVTGLLNGFATWWIPYLYIWAVLWGAVMLLPQNMPTKIKPVVYMIVCGLHGLLYGVLYAPAQAILFGLDFKGMLTWIAAGLPFDVTHGVSNLLCGVLIMPLASVLKKSEKITA